MTGAASVDQRFWAGRRVFVTGHTGFKGGWLTLWLNRLGAQVRGFALEPERPDDLYRAAGIGGLCDSVIGDLRDRAALAGAMAEFRPQIVLHLAAQSLVRRSYIEPVETFDTNVMGAAHLLEGCRACPDLEAVVVVTTDKVYENREVGTAFTEDDPLGGAEPYGLSKAAAELVTQAWRGAFFAGTGVGVASARAGNVIGGGDWSEDRLMPDAIRAFAEGSSLRLRNPDAVRPWQHVIEPLAGYLILARRLAAGEAGLARGWNFGPRDDQWYRVAEVAERAAALWGEGARWHAEPDPDGPHEATLLTLDSRRAKRELGWRARIDFQQALEMTIDWYRHWARGASPSDLRGLMVAQIGALDGAQAD